MKLKNILYTALLGGTAFVATACNDYLDVSKEMNENQTVDKTWDNPNYTRNWYGNIYLCVSEFSETGSECTAFKNPWSNLAGEISSQMSPSRDAMVAGYTASSAPYHRWATLYQYIRQANMFIKYAHDNGVGSDQSLITASEIARMKDEARFLIAYSYFSIFELYGPFCIADSIDNPAYPELGADYYPRLTVKQSVEYIDQLLADVLSRDNLPETVITTKGATPKDDAFNLRECMRPTKIAARALRAKLWVYAASPLFNGQWHIAGIQDVKNKEGEQLFSSTPDESRWQKAKQYLEELLQACEADGHGLYTWSNSAGGVDPSMSIYRLFQDFNREILWSSTENSYSDQYKMEKRTNPRGVNSCYGTVGPTQEAVDMFFTSNGLTINQDPNYHEDALVQVVNPTYDDTGANTWTDAGIFNMYANREPRFYQDVIYQGQSWFQVFETKADVANKYHVDFSLHGDAGPDSRDTPLTGYLLGKFKNRSVNHASGDRQTYARNSIIYRVAEFYLMYAEVLNELGQGEEAIKWIDKVRERAGVPTYEHMIGNTQVKDGGTFQLSTKEAIREAIQRETFVELYCEGQWFFNARRWLICGPGQLADQTRFSGMNEYGTTDIPIGTQGSYYNRTVIEKRQWSDKMYLWPIHHNVIELGQGNIPQNPGW